MSSRCDGGWPPFPEATGKPTGFVPEAAGPGPWWLSDKACAGLLAHKARHEAAGHGWGYVLQTPDKPCPTVRKDGFIPGGATVVVDNGKWRRFTSTDLRRAASFPDDYKMAGTWQDHFARIGNCVPPKFAQAIATCIREHILGDREFTYLSTFAGCGGSSLGYKWAGGHGVAAVEFDDNAVETYRLNFPDTPVLHRDICTVTAQELLDLTGLQVGDLDILDGSPPCQGFSTAGKRVLTDPRNSLFREYVRLIEGLQPKVFVMENVSGMVKGKMRLVFREIMLALKATGYTVRCKLLNAMYYEVPQSRERLIWIGVRPDIGREPGFPGPVGKPMTVQEAWADLPPQASVETELTPLYASYWRAAKPGDSIGKINQAKKLRFDAPSPTLVRKEGNGGVYHPTECRKLSLLELVRLQSFPDDWRFVGSRTAHITRIGNSVPPRFMYHIASHIRDHILPQDVTEHGP
jgi:DNA (cytosine-5)-methyltransferase 1